MWFRRVLLHKGAPREVVDGDVSLIVYVLMLTALSWP